MDTHERGREEWNWLSVVGDFVRLSHRSQVVAVCKSLLF